MPGEDRLTIWSEGFPVPVIVMFLLLLTNNNIFQLVVTDVKRMSIGLESFRTPLFLFLQTDETYCGDKWRGLLEALSSFSFQSVFGNHCDYIIIEKKGMETHLFHIGSREEPGRWIWAMERVWAEIPSSYTATALKSKMQVQSIKYYQKPGEVERV